MEPILYRIIRPVATLLLKILYAPIIKNKKNIPLKGKVILAGNHTNNLDSLMVMASTKRVVHFLAKDELFKGILKPFFSNMGLIPVNRRKKDSNSLNAAVRYLNEKKLIGIFPEGTFNKTRNIIMPFKYGAVSMAYKTNSFIVPFSITGVYKRKKAKICFGKPYKLTSDDLEKENKILMEKVKKLIIENR